MDFKKSENITSLLRDLQDNAILGCRAASLRSTGIPRNGPQEDSAILGVRGKLSSSCVRVLA